MWDEQYHQTVTDKISKILLWLRFTGWMLSGSIWGVFTWSKTCPEVLEMNKNTSIWNGKCTSGKLDAVKGKVNEFEGIEVGGIQRSAQYGEEKRMLNMHGSSWMRTRKKTENTTGEKKSWKISKLDKNHKPTDPESSAKSENKEDTSQSYYMKPGKEKNILSQRKMIHMHTCRKSHLYAETPEGDDTILIHLFTAAFLKIVKGKGSGHPLVGEWISRM